MDKELQLRCETFMHYRDLMRDSFKWDGEAMHMMSASIALARGWEPDRRKIRECEEIVKQKVDRFSPLRLALRVALVCYMAMSSDPEEYLRNVQRAYSLIRITRRHRSMKYYLAAMTLASRITDKEELLGLTDRTNEIYAELNETADPFTGGDGYALAAVFAAAGVEDPAGLVCGQECSRGDMLINVMTCSDCGSNAEMTGEAEAWLRTHYGTGFLLRRACMRTLFAAVLVSCTIRDNTFADSIAANVMLDNTMESYFIANGKR